MKDRCYSTGPTENRTDSGSALILTVVLTSLLAIVGVLFLMLARIDKMSSSATSTNRELSFAVDSVVAQICDQLVLDVPGVAGQPDYYDYPDANNLWLAELEPFGSATSPRWRRVSDITSRLAFRAQNVGIRVVRDSDRATEGILADADGDGVGDSIWVRLDGVTSNDGEPIYTAVRIIDNCAMLNVNTGYELDPAAIRLNLGGSPPFLPSVPGSKPVPPGPTSPLQVNVMPLAVSPNTADAKRDDLLLARANYGNGINHLDLVAYTSGVIQHYNSSNRYTPYDISDELELRFRFLVNHRDIDTRLEQWGLFEGNALRTPVSSGGIELQTWFQRASAGADPNYTLRHIATTCSIDRIMTPRRTLYDQAFPNGKPFDGRMFDINTTPLQGFDDVIGLDQVIWTALYDGKASQYIVEDRAYQIAVNLMDYIDDDSEVSFLPGSFSGTTRYYGFETPCIYISEVAWRIVDVQQGGVTNTYRSYAIELYKPYPTDPNPNFCSSQYNQPWQLRMDDVNEPIPIDWSHDRQFHVISFEQSQARLTGAGTPTQPVSSLQFGLGSRILLQRIVGNDEVTVDSVRIENWSEGRDSVHSIDRDSTLHRCVQRLWDPAVDETPTLGTTNRYAKTASPNVQAHPANRPLVNIGELNNIFWRSAYGLPEEVIDADVRLGLYDQDPNNYPVAMYRLFQYLTAIGQQPNFENPAEPQRKVKGRININTAPAFVLAQLPWMTYRYDDLTGAPSSVDRAQAIVTARQMYGPYRSVGDLKRVYALGDIADGGVDQTQNLFSDVPPGPDFSDDTALNDFEERNVIFARMSDLVTVRSDVFTAYILVRIGASGPQRRVVAILDRSRALRPEDKVKVLALHPVPDAR